MKPAQCACAAVKTAALALFVLHIPALALAGSLAYDQVRAEPPTTEAALLVGVLALFVAAQSATTTQGLQSAARAVSTCIATALVLLQLPAAAFLYVLVWDHIPETMRPTGESSFVFLSVIGAILFVNAGFTQRFANMEEEEEESMLQAAEGTRAWPYEAARVTTGKTKVSSPRPKRTPFQEVSVRIKNSYSRSILGPRSGNPLYQQWFS